VKIECTLSVSSISDAVKQLRKYAESLQSKTENLVQELGDYGLDSAANLLGHVDTGKTLESLKFIREGTNGTVTAGGNAVWIEFGTGVKKNGGQAGAYVHPKAAELGMSAIGTYDKGHGADPRGWWYPDGGGYKHTFGIESNQFMYQASKDMRRELLDIAKEAFKND
jgi:hypothetical protein